MHLPCLGFVKETATSIPLTLLQLLISSNESRNVVTGLLLSTAPLEPKGTELRANHREQFIASLSNK